MTEWSLPILLDRFHCDIEHKLETAPVPGSHQVYGFLTTAPSAVVEPILPKAMPVILITDEERDVWMRGPWTKPERCSGHCRMT